MANILVVHYSRTGNTRRAAERVANALGADIEAITEPRSRAGILGYLRSGREAFLRRHPRIDPPRFDPARYDLVILAAPIWNMSLASPMLSYVAAHGRNIRQWALLLSCGGMGMERVRQQLERAMGAAPRTTTVITDEDRARGRESARIDELAAAVRPLVRARPSDVGAERLSH